MVKNMVETRGGGGGGGGGGGCTAYTSSTVDVPNSRVVFFFNQGSLDQGSVFHMFPLE